LDVLFQEQTIIKTTFNGKRYESMFCSMYVVTSVTTSGLTESFPKAMLFPFSCQVSTNCKHLCFPIIPKFKELYNKSSETGKVYIILTDRTNTSWEH